MAWVTPADFGAVDDDATNDTGALQSFVAALGNGTNGRVDGRHRIVEEIQVSDKTDFVLTGRGKISAANGMKNGYGYGLLRFYNCSRFELSGLRFDGNRDNRTELEADNHGVTFQSCRYFSAKHVRSDNAICDGWMIVSSDVRNKASHNHHFTFVDCHATNCFRQGMSVIQAHDGSWIGGSFGASNGTAPQAGIDLESDIGNVDHALERLEFRGVEFASNNGFGLQISNVARPRDIRVENCTFRNNVLGAISWGARNGEVLNSVIDGFTNAALRGAIDVPPGPNGHLRVRNTVVRNFTATHPDRCLLYVHGQADGFVEAEETYVEGSAGALFSLWAPYCKVINSARLDSSRLTGHNGGIATIFGDDCVFSGNFIDGGWGSVIHWAGARGICDDNYCREATANREGGVFRFETTGGMKSVSRNHIRRATSARGYGIYLYNGAERLVENNVENYTGNPYVNLAGSIGVSYGNFANGAVVSKAMFP
jgi:hypothetical protein